MADYQKMYYVMCDAASKAIDMLPDEAKKLLQAVLQEAEDIYAATCGEDEEEKK